MTDVTAQPTRLYILMRTDLTSMNAGKAVAQGTHAANQCVFEISSRGDAALKERLAEWEGQTGHGFGTCITLGVNEAQMRTAVQVAQALGLHANICHDPTYPLVDGETVHLIPLDTCGFVFGDPDLCKLVLDRFQLMP